MVQTGRAGAAQLALGRMAVGAAGFVAPRTFGRIWIGGEGGSPRVAMLTRAFAARDFALGLGAYLAVQKDAPVRGWVEAGLLSDSLDVLTTLRGPLPLFRKLTIAGAALVAVAGGILALQGDDEPVVEEIIVVEEVEEIVAP
jgi:hypothetical protein